MRTQNDIADLLETVGRGERLLLEAIQAGGAQLTHIDEPILRGIQAQSAVVTKGMGGNLAWPALLRKLDRIDPSYRD